MAEIPPTGWARRKAGYTSQPATDVYRALPTRPGAVWLMHPSDKGIPFITFAAFDNHTEEPDQWGVQYTFVMDACYILCDTGTNNKEGYLSTSADGKSPVAAARLLPAGGYYWHTGNPDQHAVCQCNWKIVNNFELWRFPLSGEFLENGALAHWNLHALAGVFARYPREDSDYRVASRDGGCIITGGSYATHAVHLIPVDLIVWFIQCRMEIYTLRNDACNAIYDSTNAVCLKPDLHLALDNRKLVFYPKDGEFITHFLSSEMHREAQNFHNVPTGIGPGVSIHCLYGRFAFNLITQTRKLCNRFFKKNDRRRLLTDPDAVSESNERSTSSGSRSSNPSGSKSTQSMRSVSSRRYGQEPSGGSEVVQLSEILPHSVWQALLAGDLSDMPRERDTSGSAANFQSLQRVVPIETYNAGISEIKKSKVKSSIKLKALRCYGKIFRPSFCKETSPVLEDADGLASINASA